MRLFSSACWLSVLALGSACAPVSPRGGDAGPGDASDAARDDASRRDGGVREDAGVDGGSAPRLDAGMDGGSFTPSFANPGWLGGACASPADCDDVTAPICLTDGFPNGTCTVVCTGFCPDRTEASDTVTFCVDGAPYGESRGLCLSRCDTALFGASGCAEGYACAMRNRFGDPRTSADVCVPIRPNPACPAGVDELVPLDYPDRGAVWIPREAACGGQIDLLVMMHGINPASAVTPSLGGGRHLETLARALLDEEAIRPLILAEPVHFQPGSTTLYGAGYVPVTHLAMITAILTARGITLRSISFVGHSGAGCDESNGLYEVLTDLDALVPTFAPRFTMIGFIDVCYGPAYHHELPRDVLSGQDVVLVNMLATQGTDSQADSLESGLLGTPTAFSCDGASFRRCVAHPTERWCSYRSDLATGISHDNVPYWFFREVIPRVFGDGAACR